MMTGTSKEASLPSPAVVVPLALLGGALVVSVIAGASLPLITSDRRAVAGLAVLGWILCSVAAVPTIKMFGLRHRLIPVSAALGVCALVVIALTAVGWTGVLASVAALAGIDASGDRVALVVLSAIMLTKVVLGIALRASATRL